MHERVPRYLIPAMAVAIWLGFVLAATWMLQGCSSGEKQSALELMVSAEQAITTGTEALLDAVRLGQVDVASPEYAKVYAALSQANDLMDAAWVAWQAGDRITAMEGRRAAIELYTAARPLLQQLVE